MCVLVKDMEMPKDWRYTVCITHDSEGGVHWVFQNQDTLEFLKHSGVTEVPPHGRLIDADVMRTRINCKETSLGATLVEWVDEQETVIEAEEVE